MDDFDRELASNNKDNHNRVMNNNLAHYSDPYSSACNQHNNAVSHSSRAVTFQIEDEDDFMCSYEQT